MRSTRDGLGPMEERDGIVSCVFVLVVFVVLLLNCVVCSVWMYICMKAADGGVVRTRRRQRRFFALLVFSL